MKTKVEIIRETAAHYNLENLSVLNSQCVYIGPDGKNCAFGRCCDLDDPEKFKYLGNKNEFSCLTILFHYGQEILKPEYRGHEVEFWRDIQKFHDYSSNWNKTGLNGIGQKVFEDLLEKYKC